MKLTKTLLAMLLAALMVLSVVGCTKKIDVTEYTQPTAAPEITPAPTTAAPEAAEDGGLLILLIGASALVVLLMVAMLVILLRRRSR